MAYTTIKKPSDYFNTKLYSGSGSVQTISGVGFEPSFTWIKNRSYTHNHVLANAVRGSNKSVNSNTTDTETEDSANGYIMSFNSDGFVLDGSNYGWTNNNSSNYVSWNWKASGSGSANTDGSINSTVSANTTSGFSIVSWTGTGSNATVGHGLGSAPKMIIFKRLDSADDMTIYHTSLGATKKIDLNNTGASSTVSSVFNDTAPTNSLIYVGTNGRTNASGGSYIAYCFAEKTGYSKFSSYTGAGSNLPFIYTGFKPAFIMIKSSDGAYPWSMYDVKRLGYNVYNSRVVADDNIAEQGSQHLDILSNGFKLRTAGAGENGSGGNFIYMAFAEEPLVGDNPATAR
ncbi:hypothetical protein P022_gp42 [Pelagibacter phage HTVC022P]|nr:hypothetical protein P022_gp42 [Pelagibacter phage HTVC022P]